MVHGPYAGDTVATTITRMVTFDGRFPGTYIPACLTLEARALLAAVGNVPVQPGGPPPHAAGPACHLAIWEYGRPHVSMTAATDREVTAVAWAPLDAAQVAAVGEARRTLEPLHRQGDGEMDAFYAELSEEYLDRIVREATYAVDHTDPILVYVEAELFTNFDRWNNLQPKSGGKPEERFLLSRLPGVPAERLTAGERRFLFGMHLLKQAGLSAEELNGQQLTPWSLRDLFGRKCQHYLGIAEATEAWPDSIVAQAACLGRWKQRLKETYTVYRWINGINFRKEERWRPRDDWATRPALIPASLGEHALSHHGVRPEDFTHHTAYLLEVVRRIARIEAPDARSAAFEALLEAVVRAAMHELPSHVGMTRGMRDLRHFQDALEAGRFDEVCAAPMSDGYCGVFANDESLGFFAPHPPAKVLTAISRRMQFNHWHYTPGHFDDETLPGRRHFYNPPSMSDVAESGHLQHPGHSYAHVRYSIRSSAALTVGNRTYSGLVDIRLMRAVGRPYTDADLAIADRYTELIRSIAQAALSLRAEGLRAPVVSGFERPYYEARYPAPKGATASPRGEEAPAPSIGAMLREAMQKHPETAAILGSGAACRYSLAEIEPVAGRLVDAAGPAGRVVVLTPDRVQQAVLIAAGLAAGLVVCPIDPALPEASIDALVRHFDPAVLVTDLSDIHPVLPPPRGEVPRSRGGGLLIYTSGTTGTPKGVLLSEGQIGANVSFAQQHFGYDAAWVSGCLLPFHHTFGTMSDLLPVLCAGGQVVVTPGFSATDAGAVAATFAAHQVRSFSSVPLILDAMLALHVALPASLRFVISGASPLSERTRIRYFDRFDHPVISCYGLTESVCFATTTPLTGGRPGAVGKAAGIDIRVLGPDLQPVTPGEHGEIAIRGRSVITGGYFQAANGPDEPFADDGWFLTGDIGRLDADGYLFITGRRKNMIIRGGGKLYLDDVDRRLEEHPAVAEACCVQVPGLFGYERAVAFVVAAGEARPDEALRAFVLERLGVDGGPDELVWVDRIPRSATGKPLRAALRGRYAGSTWP